MFTKKIICLHCHSFQDLPFTKVSHLQNPWNEKKPVKIGRDGQEIEPSKYILLISTIFESFILPKNAHTIAIVFFLFKVLLKNYVDFFLLMMKLT